VIGASVDKPGTNERWALKHDLRMPLISDPGEHTVASAFGTARPLVGVAKRTTFLIEPDGTVRKVYTEVKAKGHAAKVLADCKEIWG
jgi:peroxiredoxin Q/BCP